MYIHEYQAKQILSRFGIALPPFSVVATLEEAKKIEWDQGVVKAQVHAGGRGKAGGVKIGKTKQEIAAHVEALLGKKLVTNQTGPEGQIVEKVLISPLVSIERELYAAALVDRNLKSAILMVSPEGGIDIETGSKDKIVKVPILLDGRVRGYNIEAIAKALNLPRDVAEPFFEALAKAFIETDASLIEINPLVLTTDGKLVALDAKMSLDDNAAFRQKELFSFYDASQISKLEAEAKSHSLEYVALDGTIGCLVNGAGLAMATMDLIKYFGGSPANFLDVGGSAPKERVAEAFKILLSDKKVRAIFVNIVGGIMNCVTLAEGIVSAASEVSLSVPLVVRMEGTEVEKGRELLKDSKLPIESVSSLSEAAKRVVELARRAS